MVEEVAIAQVSSAGVLGSYLTIIIPLALLIFGIGLLVKSKKVPSKYLKTGILIPLILSLFLIISIISGLLAMGNLLFITAYLGTPIIFVLSIVSVIFSILSLFKTQKKSLAVAALIYGLTFLISSAIILIRIILFGFKM